MENPIATQIELITEIEGETVRVLHRTFPDRNTSNQTYNMLENSPNDKSLISFSDGGTETARGYSHHKLPFARIEDNGDTSIIALHGDKLLAGDVMANFKIALKIKEDLSAHTEELGDEVHIKTSIEENQIIITLVSSSGNDFKGKVELHTTNREFTKLIFLNDYNESHFHNATVGEAGDIIFQDSAEDIMPDFVLRTLRKAFRQSLIIKKGHRPTPKQGPGNSGTAEPIAPVQQG
jgi:hypothetical protein